MPLPVTLGPDTYTYAFGVLGSTIGFCLLGLSDLPYNFFKNTNEREVKKTDSTYLPLLMTLLIHGSVLGLLIVNYINSWKNAKDNAILALMSIVLGSNLIDFMYKCFKIYNYDIWAKRTKVAMTVITALCMVAFITTAIAYSWVGSFAEQESTSRIVILVSGILCIWILAVAFATFKKDNDAAETLVRDLLLKAGVKLSVQPKAGVKVNISHKPVAVRGLNYDLTDDHPDTPLYLHAADRARFNPVPGVTADNWKIVEYKNEHYLTTPEVAAACNKLQTKWTGEVVTAENHTGDVQFWTSEIHKSGNETEFSMNAFTRVKGADEFVGYSLMDNKVHGWAKGVGIYFSTHDMFPVCFTLFMFSWYSLYLQQFTSAVLASVITLSMPLLGSIIGYAGQYVELFKWYFLVGWSIINLCDIIVDNSSKYIRQYSTWNVTDIPVQEFPVYDSADDSLQILGFSWVALAWGSLGFFVVFAQAVTKRNSNIFTSATIKPSGTETKFSNNESTPLLKENTKSNVLVRRAKYLNQ